MKRFLPFLSVVFILAACSSGPANTEVKTVQAAQPSIDTAGLAQFQQWKAQNELSVANELQPAIREAESVPVRTVEVVREVRVERPTPVKKRVATTPKRTQTSSPQPTPTNDNAGSGNDVAVNNGSTGSGETSPTQETAKKEGWSKAAKGAAIGGAGGAVIGAVIYKKNPAVGAAIGGVIGGAVGYGIGKKQDNKDGRN